MENTTGTPQTPVEQKLTAIVAWCDRIDLQIREIRNTVNAALADAAQINTPQPIAPPPYVAPTQPQPQEENVGLLPPIAVTEINPQQEKQEEITEEVITEEKSTEEVITEEKITEEKISEEVINEEKITEEVIKEETPVTPTPKYTKHTTPEPKATSEDDERTIGVKWMAVIGILIAVIGLSLFIKYLIEKDLIGPVAIVSFGYVTSLAMVGTSLKVSETRKVLKDTLLIGGTTLGWMITWLAYGHYELFPSGLTVAITLMISLGLMAFAYANENKLMFHFALLGFIFSPMVSGYSIKRHDTFWMTFTVAYNVALLFLYKYKKWVSAYGMSFFITLILEVFISFFGESYGNPVYVGYFAAVAAVFYAGVVVLYDRLNENSSALIVIDIVFFALLTFFEFFERNSTSNTYMILAAALGFTAYMFRHFKRDAKPLYNTPFALACIFFNIAFLLHRFPSPLNHWLPFMLSIDIILMAILYRNSGNESFKSLGMALVWLNFIVLYVYTPFFGERIAENFTLVFNIDLIGQLSFITILFYLYKIGFMQQSVGTAFLIMLCLMATVGLSNYKYWYLIRHNYDEEVLQCVTHLCITIMGLLGISIIMANLPKRIEWLKNFKILGQYGLLVSVFYFCISGIYVLDSLRDHIASLPASYHGWRYASLALTAVAIFFIIRNRNASLCRHFDKLSDIVAAAAIIWLVAAEINNTFHLYDLQVKRYRMFVTLWFTVSSVVLFVLGLKYKLKHLRIFGFIMTGVTILKLFFIDIWETELIVKAVVFVAIGLLFLLISYIYSKYFKDKEEE